MRSLSTCDKRAGYMVDPVILRKVESIERCLKRVRDDYVGFEERFLNEQMRQDAVLLNLQRACGLSIDLANHFIKIRSLGVPDSSRASFTLLAEAGVISRELGEALKKMVSFRNIAVHQYQDFDLAMVQSIIEKDLDVFRNFCQLALKSL